MARFRYQHIKSSVEGKAPTAAQLKVAEIGVNDFAGDEKLFIKNSSGDVVDFPRGYSREYIDDNERVIAEALNDLNSRKLDSSAYTEIWESGTGKGSAVLKGSSGTASGDYSVAEGQQTSGTGIASHAEGGGTNAHGNQSHAEGSGTIASGQSSHAEGNYTRASGNYSHAEGAGTTASGNISHAEGTSTIASGSISHAEGSGTIASGQSSHAEGNQTTAIGNYSHAEGQSTTASGNYGSHAEGSGTIASGSSSHAEGAGTRASGSCSHAEGQNTTASGTASHAEGNSTKAIGNHSHAEGNSTSALTDYSHAEGNYTTASGDSSHAEGNNTSAMTDYSHSEGYYTIASGHFSHAEGASTTASGHYSHAEGNYTTASGSYSHAEGQQTQASGDYGSHAEGGGTRASGRYGSHAEGNNTTASGDSSHAEGQYTVASGSRSHAEGYQTSGTGIASHAEGGGTTASGPYSHAEGDGTRAIGGRSHAEGNGTTASGGYSHAEGLYTVANNQSEHASGQYNVSRSSTTFGDSGNTLFSIGNGTADDARHNAFEIRQNGDIYITSGNSDIRLQDYIGSNITVDQVLDDTTSASTNPVSSKAVYKAVTDNELVWTNAFVVISGAISSHTENTEIHVTAADKEKLHTHSNKTYLDSITGNVGTMAYEDKASYSSATEVNTALGSKANTTDLADFFDDAKYELSGTTHVINFYNSNTIKATIDATDFIKDGMIDSVSLETTGGTTYLVITWNTDAGKSQTSLNVGDLFDADNYYTKTETSGATELSTAFDAIDDLVGSGFTSSSITDVIIENERIVSNALTDLDDRKLDASAYTPTDLTNYYTKSETSGATELQTAFGNKANTATTLAGYGITDAYTKSQTSGATELATAFSAKADKTSDLDGLKLKKITQAAYDALTIKDPNTLYVIVN